jgi:hypothetical protein
MTEADWLSCADPMPMLTFLQGSGRAGDRKLRLFACACGRRLWDLLTDERSRSAVEVSERLADGLATNAERRQAALTANAVLGGGAAGVAAVVVSVPAAHAATAGAANAASAVAYALFPARVNGVTTVGWRRARRVECARQCDLLRDLFGPLPFRPVAVDPSLLRWNQGTIRKLAEVIYEEREVPSGTFDKTRLALLADALEDAGSDNREMVSHLRQQEGFHVRGCWCLDLLLGKA